MNISLVSCFVCNQIQCLDSHKNDNSKKQMLQPTGWRPSSISSSVDTRERRNVSAHVSKWVLGSSWNNGGFQNTISAEEILEILYLERHGETIYLFNIKSLRHLATFHERLGISWDRDLKFGHWWLFMWPPHDPRIRWWMRFVSQPRPNYKIKTRPYAHFCNTEVIETQLSNLVQ